MPCLGKRGAFRERSVQKPGKLAEEVPGSVRKYPESAESETEKCSLPAKSVQKFLRKVFETAHSDCGATLCLHPRPDYIRREDME